MTMLDVERDLKEHSDFYTQRQDIPPQETPHFLNKDVVIPATLLFLLGAALWYMPKGRPWARLWAKSIDYALAPAYVLIIMNILAEVNIIPYHYSYNASLDRPRALLSVYLWCIFLVAPFLEAALLSSVSTTIGKAIFAIKIVDSDRKSLQFTQALKRYYMALCYGLGLFLLFPIVQFITMTKAFIDLKNFGATKWDKKLECKVEYMPIGNLRFCVGFLVFLGLVIGTIAWVQ